MIRGLEKKKYLSTLNLLGKKRVLFVSSYDEFTSELIMRCAMSCKKEYSTLPRWVYGTLSNKNWARIGNGFQTAFYKNDKPIDLILCFSDSMEIIEEVQSLGFPTLYFLYSDSKKGLAAASFCSFIIRKD